MFYELSSKFVDFADVISDVSKDQNKTNKNILRAYEIWLRTQSKKARNILIEHGIEPIIHPASLAKQ